jgi:hypothetical protein
VAVASRVDNDATLAKIKNRRILVRLRIGLYVKRIVTPYDGDDAPEDISSV